MNRFLWPLIGFVVLVVLLAGLQLRIILALAGIAALGAWFGWSFLHDYQQKRVLMFLDPQSDPLGAGYHIIQSMIAIGSGGPTGKDIFELPFVFAETMLLLLSSITFGFGMLAMNKNKVAAVNTWLFVTFLLGAGIVLAVYVAVFVLPRLGI